MAKTMEEIARLLWADAIDKAYKSTRDAEPNNPWQQRFTSGAEKYDALQQQLTKWDAEQRHKFEDQARELFKLASTRLGSAAAREIFEAAVSKRTRGTEYGRNVDQALIVHVTYTDSPTKTAEYAIKIGLDRPAAKTRLIKRIERLRKAARARGNPTDK